eukprot:GEZU01009133.1.p1 GENE.GEZU01009133.1~~GEZU01009133.1.p1  ORF type:complete len:140 (-),score=32.23 GEZU01009133.1:359-778(-)
MVIRMDHPEVFISNVSFTNDSVVINFKILFGRILISFPYEVNTDSPSSICEELKTQLLQLSSFIVHRNNNNNNQVDTEGPEAQLDLQEIMEDFQFITGEIELQLKEFLASPAYTSSDSSRVLLNATTANEAVTATATAK